MIAESVASGCLWGCGWWLGVAFSTTAVLCPLLAEYAPLFLWWGWVVGVSDRWELCPSGWLFSRVECVVIQVAPRADAVFRRCRVETRYIRGAYTNQL